MQAVVHRVTLRSDSDFGRGLPPHHLGELLAELPTTIRAAVSMAFRNRSSVTGRHPVWLDRAAEVRFVDQYREDDSVLVFEAPRIGEAAAEVYEQQSLFPECDDRPDPDDTAFDLLGDVLGDVQQQNVDSEHFDLSLLKRLTRFHRVFDNGPFHEVDFTSRRFCSSNPARLTSALVDAAKSLLGRTPPPQRVRVVGMLDGLVASAQKFSVLLDTGEKVVGVFPDDQFDALQLLWRKRVLVLGRAVYRASGRLLRIDADSVEQGENEPTVFSRMPSPPGTKIDVSKLRKPQGPRSGMAAIIGKWPGDETDEQIQEALERLS